MAVLLVTHDGSTWLPGVLEGLAEQSAAFQRLVGVDTGSRDDSRASVEAFAAHGVSVETADLSSTTSYPQAVAHGLDLVEAGPEVEWVWLLHDDARPAPDALAALLDAAERRPDVDLLGPKLREWPSLRRLLEVGVTLSGTGRRETGLERGEYDQGQHDEEREVLAVNTAGLLIRRRVLRELGGLDPRLPMFGNDLDLGWRAAVGGHRTLVVPGAVVFHAEAAHRGVRRTALTGRHTHYQERRAALYVLLVNAPARSVPFRILRLTLGTLLRMLGFVLVRSPGEAWDDLAALVSVVFRPDQVRAGRRERAARGGDPLAVRPLLPPAWTPYRHGLDFVGDVVSAITDQAADVAERRRAAAAEADPSSLAAARLRAAQEEEDELADTGAVAAFFTNPVALAMIVLVALLLVGARTALGAVSGGALSPAPADVGTWWSLYAEGYHRLGFGSDVPAPAYVGVLGLLGLVLGTEGAVSALLVLAAPVALWGAWRFLRVTGRLVSTRGAPRWILVGGSSAFALLAASSGAWGDGRLGLVVAIAILPWLAHAALGFADPDGDRRWRAGWRVGLLGTLLTAFAPTAWCLLFVLVVIVVAGGLRIAPTTMRRRDVAGPLAAAVGVPVVLLLPWWLPLLSTGASAGLVLSSGRQPAPEIGPLDVLAGRVGDLGSPVAAGVLLGVLAIAALVPRATRVPVALCWLVAALATATAAVLALFTIDLPVTPTPPGVGVLVLIARGALITAVVLGALAVARAAGTPGRPGWQRGAAWIGAAAAAVVPLAALGTFLLGDDDLDSRAESVVPAYMLQRGSEGQEYGVLVVRGDLETGLRYSVRRGEGVTLGEDEVLALAAERPSDTATVAGLLSRPTPDLVEDAAALGLQYVLLAEPADPRIAATLDAASGLDQVSTGPGSRAWELNRQPSLPPEDGGFAASARPVLLALQALALLGVVVQCAPTVRNRREER